MRGDQECFLTELGHAEVHLATPWYFLVVLMTLPIILNVNVIVWCRTLSTMRNLH